MRTSASIPKRIPKQNVPLIRDIGKSVRGRRKTPERLLQEIIRIGSETTGSILFIFGTLKTFEPLEFTIIGIIVNLTRTVPLSYRIIFIISSAQDLQKFFLRPEHRRKHRTDEKNFMN